MEDRNKARALWRALLLAAVSTTPLMLLTPGQAVAQSEPAAQVEDQAAPEEIIVTGTNIRSSGFSAVAPVQVLGRQEIEGFGAVQFNDILKAIPGNSGSEQFTEASPRAGNAQFNLRGLGYTSTLTLLNGRRAGVSPLSDETGAEFVDINQFPLSMVSRIEVLKDGASAIYGSDAVAGVVNIITRKDFEGFELSGGYQDATNRSGHVSFALGSGFERGYFNAYGTVYRQSGNLRSDFDWLVRRAGGDGVPGRSQFLNTNGAPSTYRPGGRNADGQPIGLPGGVGYADPDCEAAGGVFRIGDNGVVNRSSCLVNFMDQVGIIPDASRMQLFTEFGYEITDRLKFFSEANFSRNILKSARGPGSFSNGAVVANGEGNIFIPGDHPFNFFVRDPANANRLLYIGPDAWNPAVHQGVDLVASSRVFGNQFFGENGGKRRSQTDYMRIVGGLDWQLTDRWNASVSYQFASADFTDEQPFRYRADALNAALLAGRLNPFGTAVTRPDLVSPKDGVSRAGHSQAILDEVLTKSVDIARTEQHVIDGLISGPLFELPSGPLAVAVGGQWRSTTLDEVPDALQASGRGDNSTVAFPIHGKQTVKAAFAEVSAPITDRADAQLAVRYEDYGGTVGSSFDPKFAARYTPIDGLTLRGSVSTSFQGPTIRQTSESLTRMFLNDPTSIENGVLTCRDSGRTTNSLVRTSGDKSLKPQSALNYNLGLVLQPTAGLNMSIDYWRYRYKDLIAAGADAQAIVDQDCADGIPNDPRVIRSGSDLVTEVQTSFINVGRVVTDGFDLAGRYRWNMDGLGSFELSGDATYVRKFNVVGGEGGRFDGAGSRNFANNFRTMPKWRVTGGLAWERGPIGANAAVRYISGYKNDQSNNAPVDSYMTVDLSLAYSLMLWDDKPLVIAVGVDNLFDRNPPALYRYDADGNPIPSSVFNYIDRPGYDAYSGADIRGRVLWARFKQSF